MWLSFTAHAASNIFVAGLDHEVYCGTWSNSALNQRNLERAAFRGDARWVGLSRTSDPAERRGGDHIMGVTDSAQMYVLRNAHLQSGPVAASAVSSAAAATAAAPAAAIDAHAAARARRDAVTALRKERVAAGLAGFTPEEEQQRKLQQQQKQQRKRKAVASSGE
jgi:hypothetical protein